MGVIPSAKRMAELERLIDMAAMTNEADPIGLTRREVNLLDYCLHNINAASRIDSGEVVTLMGRRVVIIPDYFKATA